VDGTVYQGGIGFAVGGEATIFTDPIADTADDALYQSERFGSFSYELPLPNGVYELTLRFAEVYFTDPGRRVFDVDVEGATLLDDLDVFDLAGHDTAYDRSFLVSVDDNALSIELNASVNNAKLSAINVTPISPPNVTMTADPASLITGRSSTISWSATDADSCVATGFTASGMSGSFVVTPEQTTTYELSCTGDGGTTEESTTVSVSSRSGSGGSRRSLHRERQQQKHEQPTTRSCHTISSGDTIPYDYSPPWHLFKPDRDKLVKAVCDANGATVIAGLDDEDIYVYRNGYVWKDNAWHGITFTGSSSRGSWLTSEATVRLPFNRDELRQSKYVLAYTCWWDGSDWRCGCSDQSCSESDWQIQVIKL
jgi:hypothetical protein